MRSLLVAILFFSMDAKANRREEEAAKLALEAAIKQAGIDTAVENYVRQYITKDVEEKLGKVLGPVKIVVDRRINLKWEF